MNQSWFSHAGGREQVGTYRLHPGVLFSLHPCQPDPGAAHEVEEPHGDVHE